MGKKIFISAVSGADLNPKSSPVYKMIDEYKPQKVYLLHTEDIKVKKCSDEVLSIDSSDDKEKGKSLEELFNKVRCDLSKKNFIEEVQAECIKNDGSIAYKILMDEIMRIFEENIYPKNDSGETEYFINATSGLSQFKTIYVILQEIGFLKKTTLLEKSQNSDEINVLELNSLRKKKYIQNISQYLKTFDFVSCVDEMKKYKDNIPSSKDKREIINLASIYQKLFEGYALWDKVDYQGVLEKIKSCEKRLKKILSEDYYKKNEAVLQKLYDLISLQKEQLEKLCTDLQKVDVAKKAPNSSIDLFVDQYYFSLRNFRNSEYVNILSVFDNAANNMKYSVIYNSVPEPKEGLFDKKKLDNYMDNPKIIFFNKDQSLEELIQPDIYRKNQEIIKKIEEIQKDIEDNRHKLVINHGRYSIREKAAEEIMAKFLEVIKLAFHDQEVQKKIESYPFQERDFQIVDNTLAVLNYIKGE